jgi:transketolase
MRRDSKMVPKADTKLSMSCANAIRMLAVEAIQKANSGHPGAPMGMADIAFVLWTRYLRHNPDAPTWPDRDRFVLSNGHASGMLYALLHLSGYKLSIEDIKQFRQWESLTPGHPEVDHTPGVEVTTGPLGQGFSNAVGMAMAAKRLAAVTSDDSFSPVNHRIFTMMGDGCMMEGITQEAASLAGHHQLGNLIAIYDDNQITIDGPTSLAFSDNTEARFKALGWHTITCDGHNHEAIARALDEATEEADKPSLILAKTKIGWGSPNKVNTSGIHGSPLGREEIELTKAQLDWPYEPFQVPAEVYDYFRTSADFGRREEANWTQAMETWKSKAPKLYARWELHMDKPIPSGAKSALLAAVADSGAAATRQLSGKVLQVVADQTPWLIGGSADLTPSNSTALKSAGIFGPDGLVPGMSRAGAYLHGGIREHGIAAVLNGMTLHGSHRAFGGTFLVFADYMRPSMRLAAMMKLPTIFLFSHDSFMVGEDGPTHQPIEQIASIRIIAGMTLLRPADADETAMAWYYSLHEAKGPVSLLLTRQAVKPLPKPAGYTPDDILKGAYAVVDTDKPEVVILATGSEVSLAVEAAETLTKAGKKIRVVSMPSQELFLSQSKEYQNRLLAKGQARVVTIEAGVTQGWQRFAGDTGLTIGLDHYGASAPAEVLAEKFGFTSKAITEKILALLN